MEFQQIACAEFRQDAVSDFNICNSNFWFALLGNSIEVPLLELVSCNIPLKSFPFIIDSVKIPKERPLAKLIENIEIDSLYANCTVQQSQELALDGVYVGDFSSDLPKAKMQQLDWAPTNNQYMKDEPVISVLSNYGACEIRTREKTCRQWNRVICSLNQIYLQIFPFEPSSLKQVCDLHTFKEIINLHWITAFAWHSSRDLFYTANGAGWIVAFNYNAANLGTMSEYFRVQTKLGTITYMRACDDLLLMGNVMGVVEIFRLSQHSSAAHVSMSKAECLWSHPDRMACRKAEINYSKESNCYYVIFSKAAHLLCYRLSPDGLLVSSCTLYVGGIKITGLETLAHNEFVVSTITGVLKHLILYMKNDNELQVNEQIITTDVDVKNYQILGVAATPNKCMWTLMLARKKDYFSHAKKAPSSTFLSLCRLSSKNSLQTLSSLDINTMDPLLDYVVALRLDILNSTRHEEYKSYFLLQNNNALPMEVSEAFMQKLQLKLLIIKSLAVFQRERYKNIKSSTQNEIDFVRAVLQAIYIIYRMRQLQCNISSSSNQIATPFQNLAGSCLQRKFYVTLANLQTFTNDNNPLTDVTQCYIQFLMDGFKSIPRSYDCKEECLLCGDLVDETSMMCARAHKVRRCCISYVQVPLLNRRFCGKCSEIALDDDTQLMEILAPNEVLKCTFCRFIFQDDAI